MPKKEELDDQVEVVVAIGILLVACFIASLFTGCALHKVSTKAPVDIERPLYGYREIQPDKFLVWVKAGPDAPAKEELCTKSYVCTMEEAGHVVLIERTRK